MTTGYGLLVERMHIEQYQYQKMSFAFLLYLVTQVSVMFYFLLDTPLVLIMGLIQHTKLAIYAILYFLLIVSVMNASIICATYLGSPPLLYHHHTAVAIKALTGS